MELNPQHHPRVNRFGPESLAEAVALIRAGHPVAVPTETVYGLAADAMRAEAVARIYAAKGRPAFNPLIVHVGDLAAAEQLVRMTPLARRLAKAFWPGPLTLVLPLRTPTRIASLVTAGLPTLAVRVPAHRAMQGLLAQSGLPLAAPSANASGRISPVCADHVRTSLAGRIPLVIDDGFTQAGLESTIVAPMEPATGEERLKILRPGPITAEALMAFAPVCRHGLDDPLSAPGQLASHYAPTKPVRLNVTRPQADEWWIGFGQEYPGDDTFSATGDLVEAASRLFAALHRAQASPQPRIAVAPVPDHGLGAAINDRLGRAATS